MASQGNVELVRDLFAQWIAGNYESFIETAHPDVEIHSRFASLGGEPFRGAAGVWHWIAEIKQNFDHFAVQPTDFRDLGDRVLVLGAIDLQGKASGVAIHQPMGWLFEILDGKLKLVFFYSSHAEALEAAALER